MLKADLISPGANRGEMKYIPALLESPPVRTGGYTKKTRDAGWEKQRSFPSTIHTTHMPRTRKAARQRPSPGANRGRRNIYPRCSRAPRRYRGGEGVMCSNEF